MRKWLTNNVVIGNPENDSKKAFGVSNINASDRSFTQYLSIAWAKMFPGYGADHNNYTYPDNNAANADDALAAPSRPAFSVSEEQYQSFVQKGQSSQNTSFTGWSEWQAKSGRWAALAFIPILITTATNTIRLLAEGIPYFFEQACRYSIVKMRAWAVDVKDTKTTVTTNKILCHDTTNARMGMSDYQVEEQTDVSDTPLNFGPKKFLAHVLISIPILLLATGYYSFKAARLLIRTVTAPVESFRSAWGRNRALGVLSAILSIAAIVFVGAYAVPAALKSLGVVAKNLPAVKHGADILNITRKAFWMMSTSAIYVAGNAVVLGLKTIRDRVVGNISTSKVNKTANGAAKAPERILKGAHSSEINFERQYKAQAEKVKTLFNEAFKNEKIYKGFKGDQANSELIKQSLLNFPTNHQGTITFSDNLAYSKEILAIRKQQKATPTATKALEALTKLENMLRPKKKKERSSANQRNGLFNQQPIHTTQFGTEKNSTIPSLGR